MPCMLVRRVALPLWLLALAACVPQPALKDTPRPTAPGDAPAHQPAPGKIAGSLHVPFGMPAPAKTDTESREAFLIERPQYTLSYNAKTRTPNWVCWRLVKDDIGNAPRTAFEPDP